MIKVIAIVGPTAVGKTALSIQMAQQLNGEIISGDSMQVYRHLDIGTAKITPAEMQGVPHHMIDIRDIDERFSVAEFQQLATEQIRAIHARGKQPIIVGGTGFYLQALAENLTLGADQYDAQSSAIRERWQQYARTNGSDALWHQLVNLDPVAAEKIPANNVRRVIRALEVIEKTGQPFSNQQTQTPEFEMHLIGLNTDRQLLYERINQRVDQMLADGLVAEAQWLFEQGGQNFQSGKGIGYHELFNYFNDQVSFADAVEQIKRDSRHYAKRQLTWFRNKMTVTWFDLVTKQHTVSEINQYAENLL